MYHQLQQSEILFSSHIALMCFAWISEQTTVFFFHTELMYQFL